MRQSSARRSVGDIRWAGYGFIGSHARHCHPASTGLPPRTPRHRQGDTGSARRCAGRPDRCRRRASAAACASSFASVRRAASRTGSQALRADGRCVAEETARSWVSPGSCCRTQTMSADRERGAAWRDRRRQGMSRRCRGLARDGPVKRDDVTSAMHDVTRDAGEVPIGAATQARRSPWKSMSGSSRWPRERRVCTSRSDPGAAPWIAS